MSVVFVCVKRGTTMGVVGGWTGGLVCSRCKNGNISTHPKLKLNLKILHTVRTPRSSCTTLHWKRKTSEINVKEVVEKLAKVEQTLSFAAVDSVVGICVNLFYSHLILNDPQKDLTHCHLLMLKCSASHVAYITVKN